MTTQSTFEFTLTAHELAHQWFGDNVTCASWADVWLNEGFASYGEYLSLQKFRPEQAPNWMDDAHAYAFQRPLGSVKVPDTLNVDRIFDYRLTYKKAASVLHMLRYTVNNDTLFFKALRNYQQQYRGRTATTTDLKKVFEETTGQDLDYFFEQWYAGQGFPLLAVQWNQDENHLLITATQTSSSNATPFFKTDVEYLIHTTTGDTTIRVAQNQPSEQYLILLKSRVTGITINPDNWLLLQVIQNQQNTALKIPQQEQPILYPNPAYTYVQVGQLDFTPTVSEVYDALGRLVKRTSMLPQPEPLLDIRDLPAGLYILQLRNESQHYRSSFVKR
jgi:aminopeptidase N